MGRGVGGRQEGPDHDGREPPVAAVFPVALGVHDADQRQEAHDQRELEHQAHDHGQGHEEREVFPEREGPRHHFRRGVGREEVEPDWDQDEVAEHAAQAEAHQREGREEVDVLLLVGEEPDRDEAPHLVRDHGRGEEERADEGELEVAEEGALVFVVHQPRVRDLGQGVHEGQSRLFVALVEGGGLLGDREALGGDRGQLRRGRGLAEGPQSVLQGRQAILELALGFDERLQGRARRLEGLAELELLALELGQPLVEGLVRLLGRVDVVAQLLGGPAIANLLLEPRDHPVVGPQGPLHQVLLDRQAGKERDHDPADRLQEAPAQLLEVLPDRHSHVLDFVVAHWSLTVGAEYRALTGLSVQSLGES